jgi:hypothetical protein
VTFNHAGSCVINANQEGSTDYDPAPQVQQSVAVPAQLTPTFTFANLPKTAVAGDHYDTSQVTSNSAGTITFALDNTTHNACTLSDDHTSVLFQQHAGTCAFHAHITQAGDYTAADSATQTVAVPSQLTLSVTKTPNIWSPTAAQFGWDVNVQVQGLAPDVGATITLSSDHVLLAGFAPCRGLGFTVSCEIDSTTTGGRDFWALPLRSEASVDVEVTSDDGQHASTTVTWP